MDKEAMKLANQLCFSAYNVSRLFARFYEQQLKSFGLTYSQYLVLLALWESNPQTLHEIGKQLKLSSNTLTPLLKRLESAGWVKREKSSADKRQLIVTLTDKGVRNQASVYEALANCVPEEMKYEDYQEAKSIMDQLESALEKQININKG
ncbi:transcriptional regulator [Staphylococcus piscifermentans]|uniref:Transcriptional regulator n=1 Tax=Staphylococcus piscifermentans TaxID=70258 RepID=A0A239TDH5_9STAP|nr:MarR family transcriptional regulator [Staphylococcus piscifermentans]RTX86530.1 MarR family transcriptional regulator [Staphylococcus piscifermentans]GEP85101.1 transcriptional regulator [Staphylococcus piscifermentans]SNU95750.1 transcriptional regulator [Staphylococcus piscifermentans]